MVIVIGLSTAIPTMPGHSSGKVGARQLERLEMQLRQADAAGLFRVVLLHHPPRAEHAPSHKQLSDAEAFRAVIAEAGAELILHGHEHRFRFAELAGPFGSVPVFGVPSASLLPRHAAGVAGEYHLHHIARHPQGWLLETHVRSYSRAHDRFREARRGTILLQRPWTQAAPHSTAPAGV